VSPLPGVHLENGSHPTPLHLVITVGPFTKWGVDFVDCNATSVGGHQHIIPAVNYFTKWAEAMPTCNVPFQIGSLERRPNGLNHPVRL
jgi:hypothetical protein